MKYLIVLCSIFIISCSMQRSIFIDYNSDGFDITSLKGSSIRLHVNPVIDIGEFGKSFEDEYKSKSLFGSILTNKLKEKLSEYSTVYIDTNYNIDNLFLSRSFSDNKVGVKELFERTNENYLIGIKRVVFSKRVEQDPIIPTANTSTSTSRNRATDKSTTNEGKKTDACVIKIVAEVWSIKEGKKVAEFTSIGQTKIILLMYSRALNDALEYSVSNLANYIEEKKEY